MDYQYILGAFFLASALIGIFLIVILATEKRITLSRKFLLALLSVMVLVLADSFIVSVRFYRLVPHSLFLFSSLWLTIPSLIFFYGHYSLNDHKKVSWWIVLHFIPFLFFLSRTYHIYGFSAEHKIGVLFIPD